MIPSGMQSRNLNYWQPFWEIPMVVICSPCHLKLWFRYFTDLLTGNSELILEWMLFSNVENFFFLNISHIVLLINFYKKETYSVNRCFVLKEKATLSPREGKKIKKFFSFIYSASVMCHGRNIVSLYIFLLKLLLFSCLDLCFPLRNINMKE